MPATILPLLQAVVGARVVARLLRTTRGAVIAPCLTGCTGQRVAAIVPVLNERERLGPCLAGIAAQGGELLEALVVDGGSRDGTQELVREWERRDRRIRLVDAGPVPGSGNPKVHGLQSGLDRVGDEAGWVLTLDADVRPSPGLVRALLAHALRTGDDAFSVAAEQRLSGSAEALVHPAMLATLVYRLGIPGHASRRVAEVQANGQCALYRRDALERIGGFAPARGSLCEDVTLARALAAAGRRVGFYEAPGLVETGMYDGWADALRNWSRSLPLRDPCAGRGTWVSLAEVTLAQAVPLPLLLVGLRRRGFALTLLRVNLALVTLRLGVLAGTARAYPDRPWTYWLSPLADLPVAAMLWRNALRRRHVWRGRTVERDDTGGTR